jgi:serine/threonine-protein kinase
MTIAGFRIERKLGSGGMGEVWLAEQTSMGRKAALKILAPGLSSNRDFVGRFLREAQMAGKVEHPNIVTAYGSGQEGGIYYLASAFVDGTELGTLLEQGRPLPETEALKIARAAAAALRHAWDEHKIIHRDIKPANIMVDKRGVPKVLDMGISKSLAGADANLTSTGMAVGTPYYMSPEQIMCKPLDFRADIYSLGATLYHCLTGAEPYRADAASGVLVMHISAPVPNPRSLNPRVSEKCAALIRVMMAKNMGDRQKNWTEVIRDIDLILNNGAAPEPRSPDSDKNKARPFIIAGVALLILTLILWKCDSAGGGQGQGAGQGSGQGSGQGAGQGSGQGSGQGPGQGSGQGPGQGSGGGSGANKGPSSSAAQPTGGGPGSESAQKTAAGGGETTAQKTADKSPDSGAAGESSPPAQKPSGKRTELSAEEQELYNIKNKWSPSANEKEVWEQAKLYTRRLARAGAGDPVFPEPGAPGTSVKRVGEGKFKVEGFFEAPAKDGGKKRVRFSVEYDAGSYKCHNLEIKRN